LRPHLAVSRGLETSLRSCVANASKAVCLQDGASRLYQFRHVPVYFFRCSDILANFCAHVFLPMSQSASSLTRGQSLRDCDDC